METLKHDWFQEYSVEKPRKMARRDAKRIRCVQLSGDPPLCRKGLPAENLLSAKTGMFNGGFCSYMGMTSVNIDFELVGQKDEEFWVTDVAVSLWGKAENPRMIILQTAVRPGAPYIDAVRHPVESVDDVEAG
mmetsp:Transcript_3290/g.8370  ORF Transcript_3290/g.8370 Transcript_3290/m.8370 type:complete len:133 (-) Transcript_3290:16-414(-)